MEKPNIYDMEIYYAVDRCAHINNIITENENSENSRKFRDSELEAMGNYILYGKNTNGKSAVDNKQIEIKGKSGNFARKAPSSIEELTESPTFDERNFKPLKKSVYRVLKPTIDREADAWIPGMKELWEVIDELQYRLDVCMSKKEAEEGRPVPKRSGLEIYHLRHWLIDIRRQQFYLKDSHKPTLGIQIYNFGNQAPPYVEWNSHHVPYAVAPLGIMYGSEKRFFDPRNCGNSDDYEIPTDKEILDFRNKQHIYELLERYSHLRQQSWEYPDGPLWYIMDTLDFYVEFANLPESRMHLLTRKIDRATNDIIRGEMYELYGLSYNVNYISTIWTQEICGKIASGANFHRKMWDNRNNPENWKECNYCHKWKLRDSYEFVKKKRSKDGFSGHCKICDKIKRGVTNK